MTYGIEIAGAAVAVERVERYSSGLGQVLGRSLVHLTGETDTEPIPEAKLRFNIDNPGAEQLIAVSNTQILGAATLTQLGGLMPHAKAWLEDFFVVPEARGKGVADALADEWEAWCREREITTLMFTSGWHREAAHRFYKRRGAVILNTPSDRTAFFNYPVPLEGGTE